MMTETTRVVQSLIDQALRGDAAARQELLELYRENLRRMVASPARSSAGLSG